MSIAQFAERGGLGNGKQRDTTLATDDDTKANANTQRVPSLLVVDLLRRNTLHLEYDTRLFLHRHAIALSALVKDTYDNFLSKYLPASK